MHVYTNEFGASVADEYRAKIESGFSRIRKLSASDGKTYWEVTDKGGTRYLYGQSSATRQDNPMNQPNDPNYKIFKWCLDRVEDTNGNFMTFSYFKDQAEIYLDRIDYAGNGTALPTTNYVKFWLDDGTRTDAPVIVLTTSL